MSIKYDTTYDELYAIELLKGSFLSEVKEFIKSESPDWISGDGGIGIEVTRAQNPHEGKVWNAWNNNAGKEISKINKAERTVLEKHASYEDGKLKVCWIYEDADVPLRNMKEIFAKKLEKLNKNFKVCDSNRLFIFLDGTVNGGEIFETIMLLQEKQRESSFFFDTIYILKDDRFYKYDMKFFEEKVEVIELSEEDMRNIKLRALEEKDRCEWKNGDVYK